MKPLRITAYDPTAHLPDDAFEHLPDKDRKRIVELLARVSERAYRRGAQQGAHIQEARPHTLPSSLHDWRYGTTLATSPWIDSHNRETAVRRLEIEIGRQLLRVGLKTYGEG
jgi:hypothetical protein